MRRRWLLVTPLLALPLQAEPVRLLRAVTSNRTIDAFTRYTFVMATGGQALQQLDIAWQVKPFGLSLPPLDQIQLKNEGKAVVCTPTYRAGVLRVTFEPVVSSELTLILNRLRNPRAEGSYNLEVTAYPVGAAPQFVGFARLVFRSGSRNSS